MEKYVGKDVHHQRKMGIQHFGMKAGILLACKSIGHAPHSIKLLGNVQGTPPLRTLKEHVFNEVG
jgi:hypothetical protein